MNEDQLRETIEGCLRSEFASALETELETQEETLREQFEENNLPQLLEDYKARMWEFFEDSLEDSVGERLQAYLDDIAEPKA
jgi:hypothetical protein